MCNSCKEEEFTCVECGGFSDHTVRHAYITDAFGSKHEVDITEPYQDILINENPNLNKQLCYKCKKENNNENEK